MAGLEQVLFENGLPVEALMEKAALAISRRLQDPDLWPELQARGALVLVGPGHNGGDGLVIARELQLAGIPVRLWSPFERRKPLTENHLRQALWLGIPQLNSPPDPSDPAVWIDALFGIGQSRPPGDALESLLAQRQRHQPQRLIAIDAPTGLCTDRGLPLGQTAATAGRTLTIGLIKQGLIQDSALAWTGALERIDLGLPAGLLEQLPAQQPRGLGPRDLDGAPWPRPAAAASKYQRGRLLVVAGSDAYRGAALLALLGASASGLGSLRAAVPEAVADQLWSQLPHAVLSARLPSRGDGSLDLSALAPSALERLDALVLGPGIGNTADDAAIWETLQAFPGCGAAPAPAGSPPIPANFIASSPISPAYRHWRPARRRPSRAAAPCCSRGPAASLRIPAESAGSSGAPATMPPAQAWAMSWRATPEDWVPSRRPAAPAAVVPCSPWQPWPTPAPGCKSARCTASALLHRIRLPKCWPRWREKRSQGLLTESAAASCAPESQKCCDLSYLKAEALLKSQHFQKKP